MKVLCSVMLSRRLSPRDPHRPRFSVERHALRVQTGIARFRTPTCWQWWQVIHRHSSHDAIERAIEHLLAGPVLPPARRVAGRACPNHPARTGSTMSAGFCALAGAASNLKLHITDYFP
jgi:hypothetical protein